MRLAIRMFYNLVWITQKLMGQILTSLDRPLQLLSETSLFDGCRIFEIVLAQNGAFFVGKCGSGTVVRVGIISSRILPHQGEIMNQTQQCSQRRYIRPSLTSAHSCLACCSSFATEFLIPLAGQNVSNRGGTSFLVPTSLGGFPTASARDRHQHRLRDDGGPCPRRVDQTCAPRDLSC